MQGNTLDKQRRRAARPHFLSICLVALLSLAPSLFARSPSPGFLGFWEIPEPAGDTAVVIVKRGGEISAFWAGSGASGILQGRWTLEDSSLVAQWNSGQLERFRLLGDNTILRQTFAPGATLDDHPVAETRGERVDPRMPGSLTVQTDRPRTRESALPESETGVLPLRSFYTGFWQVEQSTGFLGVGGAQSPHFVLNLLRGGTARVALRNWDGPNDQTGTWTIEDGKAVISWPDGRRDLLQPKGDGHELLVFDRARRFPDRPASNRSTTKISAADGMRYFDAGEFRMLTLENMRGRWIPLNSQEGGDRFVEIAQWGQATRNSPEDGTAPMRGQWRFMRDRVVIQWNNGSKDVLRIGHQTFILDHFAPGDPVTGTPQRSTPVRRLVPETLTYTPETR